MKLFTHSYNATQSYHFAEQTTGIGMCDTVTCSMGFLVLPEVFLPVQIHISLVTAYWCDLTDLDYTTVNKVSQDSAIISCDFTLALMGFAFHQHSNLRVTVHYTGAPSFN